MNDDFYLFPAQSTQQPRANTFTFNVGAGDKPAEHSIFLRDTGTNKWYVSGGNGTVAEKNFYNFGAFVEAPETDITGQTFTLQNGLRFVHQFSVTSPTGWSGVRVVHASQASLTITINIAAGTAKGTFSAQFAEPALTVNGAFDLIRVA